MALLEISKRADSKAQLAFQAAPKESDVWDRLCEDVSKSLRDKVSGFTGLFSSLVGSNSNPESSTTSETEHTAPKGIYGVTYQRYPIASYVQLPPVLAPFVQLPGLDHILLIGRPTADVSGGMAGYRDVCPKALRAAAPFLIVLDRPDIKNLEPKYRWVTFPLAEVFKLDVRGMKSIDDYTKILSKKGRWNFKDRQKKFNNAKVIKHEYVDLPPGSTEMVASLWPLYKSTGDANGFCVLSEKEFADFHLNTPGLTLMLIRDVAAEGKLITFCTGVRVEDTLMPMWCGTDYENPLAKSCSTYFNMLYEYVKVAIADPEINWVDLGASRRQAKTSIGFQGYPVSAYIRCKNAIMESIVETMAADYFKPSELIADP